MEFKRKAWNLDDEMVMLQKINDALREENLYLREELLKLREKKLAGLGPKDLKFDFILRG